MHFRPKGRKVRGYILLYVSAQTLITDLAELLAINISSYEGQIWRKHTILKAYAGRSQRPDDIMLLGQTETQRTEDNRTLTPFTARLRLDRKNDSMIVIKTYDIFPVSSQTLKGNSDTSNLVL